MYCDVKEAFDNPLRQQMAALEKRTNNKQQIINSVENERLAYQVPKMSHEDIVKRTTLQYPDSPQPFINAQGDITSNINYQSGQGYYPGSNDTITQTITGEGTSIRDLQTREDAEIPNLEEISQISEISDLSENSTRDKNKSRDSMLSLDDVGSVGSLVSTPTQQSISSLPSMPSIPSMPSLDFMPGQTNNTNWNNWLNNNNGSWSGGNSGNKNKRTHSHEYYIRNFLREFKGDDTTSLSGEEIEEVYDHIKSCRYCRDTVKEDKVKAPESKPEESGSDFFGTNIKEIILVIAAGIIVMLIIHLLLNLSKKINAKS